MFIRRLTTRLTLLTAVFLAGAASACNDPTLLSAPESPNAARLDAKHAGKLSGTVVKAAVLRRAKALETDETSCGLVTPISARGRTTISLEHAGLAITFADGAVSSPTNVCLVAHAGALLTYSFYPHGLHFRAAVAVQQDLRGTTAFHNSAMMSGLFGGYLANEVANDVDVDGVGTFAQTFEVFDADSASAAPKGTTSFVRFYTDHFSGYALASGRL